VNEDTQMTDMLSNMLSNRGEIVNSQQYFLNYLFRCDIEWESIVLRIGLNETYENEVKI
jgi:hypothetical protein